MTVHAPERTETRYVLTCPCKGTGQVHKGGKGPLGWYAPCPDRDCALRRDAEWMGVSRELTLRYFGTPVAERRKDSHG